MRRESQKARSTITSNDKGIAQAFNKLEQSPVTAWEARTLPLSYARSRFVCKQS